MDLAIVIPAYKDQYLEATLLSITKQTNKNFKVYIGDDDSPNELYDIVQRFEDKLSLVYKKFDNNLGLKNLTSHWDRCVAMSTNEKWIWLFSDDDIMDKDCVGQFYQALSVTHSYYDLYRFNTKIIDNKGDLICFNPRHPQFESIDQFITDKLSLKRSSYVTDYIFSKQKYTTTGGFISFPLGWSSDEATWFNFGYSKGIYTIDHPDVSWRYSFNNISALSKLGNEKIEATLQYLTWLKHWINNHYPSDASLGETYKKTRLKWLMHQVSLLKKTYNLMDIYRFSILFKRRLAVPFQISFLLFMSLNYNSWRSNFKSRLRNLVKFVYAKT